LEIDKEQHMIQLLALNKSTREVSKITGIPQSTVSRFANRKKDAIKKQTERLISVLPDIVDDLIRDVKTSTNLSKLFAGEIEMEDMPSLLMTEKSILTKFMDLSYKTKSDVLKALGVYPSHAPSIFIQNLFQSEGSTLISEKILTLVGNRLTDNIKPIDDEVIDAELEGPEFLALKLLEKFRYRSVT